MVVFIILACATSWIAWFLPYRIDWVYFVASDFLYGGCILN
jgi:hypothetical protein